MPSERPQDPNRVIPFRLRLRSNRFVACSVCLRVHDGGAWVDAEEAIRHLRTFEHKHVVRLGGALCDRCDMELRLRRQTAAEQLAA
jgi:hypothetical protein